MKIDVRIAYEPGGLLGQDYNRIFSETVHEWVLLIDHDIMLNTNPLWYAICQRSIETYPDTGMFSCLTNARHKTSQKVKHAPPGHDAETHQEFAREIWEANQYQCELVQSGGKIAGFFMLIARSAWAHVGGFRGTGMFEEDWDFTRRLHEHHIPIRIMRGLYVMHAQRRLGTWDQSVETSREIYDREIRGTRFPR